MEDVIVRRRTARNNMHYRKKRKNTSESLSLLEIIVRQVLIAVLILVVLGVVKSINTPVTNFASEKTKELLFQNIDLKSLYDMIDNTVSTLQNNGPKDKDGNSTQQQVVPDSKSVSTGTNVSTSTSSVTKDKVKSGDLSDDKTVIKNEANPKTSITQNDQKTAADN